METLNRCILCFPSYLFLHRVTAGSHLHINMTNDKDSDTEEHNEMWWCEVYHGNITLRSNMMSLHMSTGMHLSRCTLHDY